MHISFRGGELGRAIGAGNNFTSGRWRKTAPAIRIAAGILRVFQELIRVGTRRKTQIEIVTPVITLKKSAIIRRGIELGAPLHLNLVVLPERRYRLRRLR